MEFIRHRKTELLGIVTLVFILAGLLATIVSGNTFFTLAKASVFTAMLGLAFLVSLALPRPLAFYFGRQVMTGGQPEGVQRWNELWQYGQFRQANRVVSCLWGVGLIGEATLRVALAIVLPVSVFLAVWSPASYVIYAGLMFGTVAYARRKAPRDS